MTPTATARGLTAAEVADRVADGRSNDVPDPTSRTIDQIVRANVFTPFNLVLGILLVVITAVGEFKDALFGVVLVLNTLIGIVQEVRSKRALDRLAVINAPRACVVRDAMESEIPVKALVLDDLVILRPGDQISVDGRVIAATGLEVDESLLTGEADPLDKAEGDPVLSGSFVAAGSGRMVATAVGSESYAFKLSADARRFTLVKSELRDGVNTIIKWVGWLMLPTAALLITAQIRSHLGPVRAVQASVAGLVAMVPEGLVLLTSVAFAVSATRLARQKVLTQELAAIEGLARVDVICLDKTGTLTEGRLVLGNVEHLDDTHAGDTPAALAAMAGADDHPNPSLLAIRDAYDTPPGWTLTDTVPFSSARKWSAAAFDGHGAWLLGAPDILLTHAPDPGGAAAATERLQHWAERGRRVLLLARAPDGLRGEDLPEVLVPTALVVLDEKLRESAPATMAYFAQQHLAVKVISGDNPTTVGAVAARCGVPGADRPVDGRSLPEDPDALAEVMERHSVFGRVTPHQKRAMVHALQARGHEVAMTGDGVNDTLALKDADIGVAMGSGSAAARAVARFVLLDNDFAVFPSVVSEGRRVIANVERVANLFLTKTFYALFMALVVGVASLPYPFIPRHFTLISSLTIGIPGFFLALAPNDRRARTGFLGRVLRFAVPAGLVAGVATMVSYLVARHHGELSLEQQRTVAVITLFIVAMWVLGILARPLNSWRLGMILGIGGAFVAVLILPPLRHYFDLPVPGDAMTLAAIGIGAVAAALIEVGWRLLGWARPTD
ncbi:MAG TPA: HAD-IC family P-type ATPase [Acidimicrobiales bacterium]